MFLRILITLSLLVMTLSVFEEKLSVFVTFGEIAKDFNTVNLVGFGIASSNAPRCLAT